MLTIRNVQVWDTDEHIDVIARTAPSADTPRSPEAIIEPGVVNEGVVDGSGLTLAPGFADPHVHFRDPGQREKEDMLSGARAAASGGYTDVLIMPNTIPAADGRSFSPDENGDAGSMSKEHVGGEYIGASEPGADELRQCGATSVLDYLDRYEHTHGTSLPVHYMLSICASRRREGALATSAEDIARLSSLQHRLAAISDDGSAIEPGILDQVLHTAQVTGLPVLEHCEHHDRGVINEGAVSRELGVPGVPAATELAVVSRDIEAVRRTGVAVHFQHVSTATAFDAIRQAKAEGLPVTCETAPHYLALCDEDVRELGAMAKMNPPLRSRVDRQATLEAVTDGTVDMIATDHAPHTISDKQAGLQAAPNGIIGLETAYGVCHRALVDSKLIDEKRLIELMSVRPMNLMGVTATDITAMLDGASPAAVPQSAPRRVLDLRNTSGLPPANLVLLDTKRHWTVEPQRFHSKARNTPFAGWELTGLPLATVLDGRLVMSRIPHARLETNS